MATVPTFYCTSEDLIRRFPNQVPILPQSPTGEINQPQMDAAIADATHKIDGQLPFLRDPATPPTAITDDLLQAVNDICIAFAAFNMNTLSSGSEDMRLRYSSAERSLKSLSQYNQRGIESVRGIMDTKFSYRFAGDSSTAGTRDPSQVDPDDGEIRGTIYFTKQAPPTL